MTTAEQMAALQSKVAELTHRAGVLEDIQAIRTLHFTYGYYMDRCLFPDIVDLFADDCTLYFLNGIFRGKQGARRMYGGASGLNGPSFGVLTDHLQLQDVVDVAPDRQSAKARFRCFLSAGVHQSRTERPGRIPDQFWEGGVYENEYVKQDGVWKIKLFNYHVVWQADYDKGWAHSSPGPLMVSLFTQTYPENPRGPDELRPAPPLWPNTYVVPFHYPHPITGAPVK